MDTQTTQSRLLGDLVCMLRAGHSRLISSAFSEVLARIQDKQRAARLVLDGIEADMMPVFFSSGGLVRFVPEQMEAFLAAFGEFRGAVETKFVDLLLRVDVERRFVLPGSGFYDHYVEVVFE